METHVTPRLGFTLIEMLSTVAILVILLGLMVSLARHVRERSAQALTKDLLRRLDAALEAYAGRYNTSLPEVTVFPPDEVVMQVAPASAGGQLPLDPPAMNAKALDAALRGATANNRDLVMRFKADAGPVSRINADRASAEGMLSALPVSVYDGSNLRDAWGSPVVFMPSKHPWVGTAPREKPYFVFSAGPDRDYFTRDDNLYSYEEIVGK